MQFTIKKGHHYSKPSYTRIHFGITKIKFKIKFSKECLYPINDTDDYDINKGYGFSHFLHHHDSVRLGWVPSTSQIDRIELYKYIYNGGKRIPDYEPITTVEVEKWYECTIEINELFQTVTFCITDAQTGFSLCTASTSYKCPKFKWGYKLDPFFGGDHVSPHDMTICVEEIPY